MSFRVILIEKERKALGKGMVCDYETSKDTIQLSLGLRCYTFTPMKQECSDFYLEICEEFCKFSFRLSHCGSMQLARKLLKINFQLFVPLQKVVPCL
jgi:hypothetical protein